jgi:hypothetical protein
LPYLGAEQATDVVLAVLAHDALDRHLLLAARAPGKSHVSTRNTPAHTHTYTYRDRHTHTARDTDAERERERERAETKTETDRDKQDSRELERVGGTELVLIAEL